MSQSCCPPVDASGGASTHGGPAEPQDGLFRPPSPYPDCFPDASQRPLWEAGIRRKAPPYGHYLGSSTVAPVDGGLTSAAEWSSPAVQLDPRCGSAYANGIALTQGCQARQRVHQLPELIAAHLEIAVLIEGSARRR